MSRGLKLGASLITLYLIVNYASGSGSVITAATAGGVNVIKAFQGR